MEYILQQASFSNPNNFKKIDKADIENVITNGQNKELIAEILSQNFIGLDEPCSVSLGILNMRKQFKSLRTNKEDISSLDIVNILRTHGINAVENNSPQAKDLNCFVVGNSGISFPFMHPRDALKASADIIDILTNEKVDILGYANPVVKDNLVYCTENLALRTDHSIKTPYNKELISDIEEHYQDVSSFIKYMNEAAESDMLHIDIKDLSAQNAVNNHKSIFRGGTLGASPYALISPARSRDVAYSTLHADIAYEYCGGDHSYNPEAGGFLYQYEASDDLRTYAHLGIETRGKKNQAIEEDEALDYETPVFKNKNKLQAIYYKHNNKLVKIADGNGKYVSKEWEMFAKLHNPYIQSPNSIMMERQNNQKKNLDDGKDIVVPYTRTGPLPKYIKFDKNTSKDDFLSSITHICHTSEINGKTVIKNEISLESNDIKAFPSSAKDIVFRRLKLSFVEKGDNLDLAQFQKIKADQCKLSNADVVDMKNATEIHLGINQDLRKTVLVLNDDIKLRAHSVKFPPIEKMSIRDGDVSNCDFSKIGMLTVGKDIITGSKLPPILDISALKSNDILKRNDTSNVQMVICKNVFQKLKCKFTNPSLKIITSRDLIKKSNRDIVKFATYMAQKKLTQLKFEKDLPLLKDKTGRVFSNIPNTSKQTTMSSQMIALMQKKQRF